MPIILCAKRVAVLRHILQPAETGTLLRAQEDAPNSRKRARNSSAGQGGGDEGDWPDETAADTQPAGEEADAQRTDQSLAVSEEAPGDTPAPAQKVRCASPLRAAEPQAAPQCSYARNDDTDRECPALSRGLCLPKDTSWQQHARGMGWCVCAWRGAEGEEGCWMDPLRAQGKKTDAWVPNEWEVFKDIPLDMQPRPLLKVRRPVRLDGRVPALHGPLTTP